MKRLRIVLILVTLATAASFLEAPTRRAVRLSVGQLRQSYGVVASTSIDQRFLEQYGDCTKHGYGYLKRVWSAFPERDAFPAVRNPEADNVGGILLPGVRSKTEERVLVGIGISKRDLQERVIATARLRSQQPSPLRGAAWEFVTETGYDLMTGLLLHFASDSGVALRLTLIQSPWETAGLDPWHVRLPGHQRDVVFRLPRALSRFSIGRGATPFLLDVRAEDTEQGTGELRALSGIDVLGVKVDLREFEVIHRYENCFTAIRRDLLAQIEANPGDPRSTWLTRIRDGRTH